jgi:hypothetical protein
VACHAAVKRKGPSSSTAKCFRCAKFKIKCVFRVGAMPAPAAPGTAGPPALSAARPSAAGQPAHAADRAPARAAAAAGKRSAAVAFVRRAEAAAAQLPATAPASPAPLQQAPEDGARPAAGAEAGAGCPAAIELAAGAAAGVELIPAATRAAAGAHDCVERVLAAVRTAGEQLEQERAKRLRQAAEYDDILDTLTARNDTLRAAIDRYKTAAHVATARAATAEAELAAVRGRGADMAPPVVLAPAPPPAATATERTLRAIATSGEDFLTDADMLIAADAPQAGGAVLLQPDRPARGEGTAAGSPAAEPPPVPAAPPLLGPPPSPGYCRLKFEI